MKAILAAAALCAVVCPVWAAERVIAKPGPHPRLLLTVQQAGTLRTRLAGQPWAATALATVLGNAGEWLDKPIELPGRGGQWWHHYSCKTCGSVLKTLSPTQHQCPTCKKIYTGEPYDTVILSRAHSGLATACRDLGLAYQVKQDARYAAKARDILLAYADRYQKYKRHTIRGDDRVGGGRVGSQTLDEAVWLIPMVQGCDLVHAALSPADRTTIEQGLLRPAAKTIRDHKIGIHNIQCWKNSAVGLVGLYLADQDLIDSAFNSPRGFYQQMAKGVRADGSWYEGAWGYHFYTVRAVEALVIAGESSGIEMAVPQYLAMFRAPLQQALPNLTLPGLNDSADVDLSLSRGLFEDAYRRSGDAALLRVLNSGPRNSLQAVLWGADKLPPAPEAADAGRNSEAGGIAILQLDSGPDAVCVMMDYGPHGGGHGHPDKLSIIVYGYGGIRALDPGCIRYGAPLHGKWYRQTISHNTVALDGRSQNRATGKLHYFKVSRPDGPVRYACVSASADAALPGVRFRRSLALLDAGIIIDVTELEGGKEHTFDWALHCRGKLTQSPGGENAESLGASAGYEVPKDVRRTTTGASRAAHWQDARATLTLEMDAAPGTEVYTAIAPGNPPAERVPMAVARRRGTGTRYVSVMQLAAKPAPLRWRVLPGDGLKIAIETPAGPRTFDVAAGEVAAQ